MLFYKPFEMKRKIILCFLIVVSQISIYGQGNINILSSDQCSFLLKESDHAFSNGLYEICIEKTELLLSSCKLSKKEKEHALEMLAKAYVETHDAGKAEAVVKTLLNKFPHYELNENGNSEYYNRLIKKYNIHPLISIGIRNTGLWRLYNTSEIFTISDGPLNTEPYYAEAYTFTYYGWAEIEFNKGISLNGDLMIWTSKYNRSGIKGTGLEIDYWEYHEFVEIPLYLKKYFKAPGNILPYVTAGLGWLYMYQATGNVNKYNSEDDLIYIMNNINVLDMRNRHNIEWLAGAGVGYKIKNLRMFADMRYYGGITSLTNPSRRFENETLINEYSYIDNSVKMNKFEVGVSIAYTFKNSVKKIRY
jgi:hypothetical protein